MDPQPPAQPRSAAVYDGPGGGGKVTKTKRSWRFNPYSRHPPPEAPSPQRPRSPNWISGIASGAAKILSAVFDSSSSSSESDEELEEELGLDDDVNYNSDFDGQLNGTNRSNVEAERKEVIKQLLLQETFSREECDMLVKIIHSRVLEHSSVDRVEMDGSALTPIRSILNVTPEHAVMEAKKFLEEKKAERSLQSEFGLGSSGLYSAMIQHRESDAGSPADMAKSYMQARAPGASPSTGHFELRTPSTLLTHLTSEENLHSLSKERKFLSSGAWNMQEEIRRVRSKAIEDMLRPSSKDTNFSSRNGSEGAEVTETDLLPNSEIQKANSVPPSPASLSEGDAIGENQRRTIEGNIATSHEKMTNNSLLQYKCELLSELDVDVPTGNDFVNVDSGSQKSYEDLSQEQSEPEGKQVVAGKSDGVSMNQQAKKTVRRQPRRQRKAA